MKKIELGQTQWKKLCAEVYSGFCDAALGDRDENMDLAVHYTPPHSPSGLRTDSEQSEDSPRTVWAVWVKS